MTDGEKIYATTRTLPVGTLYSTVLLTVLVLVPYSYLYRISVAVSGTVKHEERIVHYCTPYAVT